MSDDYSERNVDYVDELLSSEELEIFDKGKVRKLLLDAMEEAVRMRDDDFDPPKDW